MRNYTIALALGLCSGICVAHDLSADNTVTVTIPGSTEHSNWKNDTANIVMRFTTKPAGSTSQGPGRSPEGVDEDSERVLTAKFTETCVWSSTYRRTYTATQFNVNQTTDPESGNFVCTGMATVTNTSDRAISGYIGLYSWDNKSNYWLAALVAPVQLGARQTCSAKVNDVDLGTMSPGETRNAEITVIKSGAGTGTVTFTGTDLQTSGDLQLGGSSTIWVRPNDDSFIDAATGHWVSGGAVNTVPLQATVGNGTAGGTYTSNLTATLTCE